MPEPRRERHFVAFDRYGEDRLIKAAKAFAQEHGYRGYGGGWIADPNGRTVAQGWWTFTTQFRKRILDWLTAKYTAYDSFDAWITASTTDCQFPSTYRPTLMVAKATDWGYAVLADAWDEEMRKRNDPRRTFRGAWWDDLVSKLG